VKFLKISLALLVPFLLLASFVFLTTGAASYKIYVIHTGSMSPTIPSGSAVLVHEGHYHVGQVITFTEDGLTVTHRLISISSAGLTTTKGDGNPTNDPWHVPTSQIIGDVVLAPRDVGYWIRYLKNPLGLGSVLFAVLLVWQAWSMMSSGGTEGKDSDDSRTQRRRRRAAHIAFPRPAESEIEDDQTAIPELVTSAGESVLENWDSQPSVPNVTTSTHAVLPEFGEYREAVSEALSPAVEDSLPVYDDLGPWLPEAPTAVDVQSLAEFEEIPPVIPEISLPTAKDFLSEVEDVHSAVPAFVSFAGDPLFENASYRPTASGVVLPEAEASAPDLEESRPADRGVVPSAEDFQIVDNQPPDPELEASAEDFDAENEAISREIEESRRPDYSQLFGPTRDVKSGDKLDQALSTRWR
jgi:signal peptidase I